MLAKETDKPFSDKEWIYEIKWDGYRAIAEVDQASVQLYSRNGNTFNASYPPIVDALKKLKINATLDGEIIIPEESGKSNFQLLQHYKTANEYPLEYRVFDLLSLNGQDTCGLPLLDRKELLKTLVSGKDNIVKYSDHIVGSGLEFFDATQQKDLEGIMAKKADSLYRPGVRTNEWLKIKHHKSVEAVIAGFTEPTGSRKFFGALVLGVYRDEKLIYIGHTGSGFNTSSLAEMNKILKPLIQKRSPFNETVKTNMPVTWVKPVLLCEVKYTEWTNDGHLRHPIFLRLRTDKKIKDINNEEAMTERKKSPAKESEKVIVSGTRKVKITHSDKLFWPEEKITKGDVVDYYQSISKYILPFLKNRPESLKRNPNGIKDSGFYHKDAGAEAPAWAKTEKIFSESANKDIDYIICNNAPTLAYLNNLGCIEINPWHSTILKLDHPDYLIIDIDPSEKNTFEQVIETAITIREIFKNIGVESYCKTSGATGMHVYVPTQKKYTYDQLKDFAHLICLLAQQKLPAFTSLERNLKKRGNKMIYLDHLQNRRGQTISSVYSLRPKEGAPVSMPLKWKEVKPGLKPSDFHIYNALERIRKNATLFSEVLGKGIDLKKCLRLMDGKKK